jgi:hypothetical protein
MNFRLYRKYNKYLLINNKYLPFIGKLNNEYLCAVKPIYKFISELSDCSD